MLSSRGIRWMRCVPPSWRKGARTMPWGIAPNRSEEYRKWAEEARMKAEVTVDPGARHALLQTAETWERMAEWEDKNNPPRNPPDSK